MSMTQDNSWQGLPASFLEDCVIHAFFHGIDNSPVCKDCLKIADKAGAISFENVLGFHQVQKPSMG